MVRIAHHFEFSSSNWRRPLRTDIVGASWPRDRKYEEIPQFQGSRLCQRCKSAPETMHHRGWTCPANV
eukprot:4325842-Pyramimonas_sp.AAC.1